MGRLQFDVKYRPQIESGEYMVETRDGKHVRILCYDANNIVPIVALVTFNDGSEGACHYYSNGAMYCEETPLDLFIVTQEEELTPFEKELVDILKCLSGRPSEQTYEDYAKEQTAQLLSLAREQFIKDGYVIEKKAFHDAVKKVDPEVMKEVFENIDNAERTEFERELVNFFNEGNTILPDKDGVYNKRDCEEFLHKSANKLLTLAEKELSAKYKVSSDLNGFAYGKGYEDGKKEALKDLPRWRRYSNSNNRGYGIHAGLLLNGDWLIELEDLEKLPKEDEK